MIGGIKRRLAKSIEEQPWDADQELEPEAEEVFTPETEEGVETVPRDGYRAPGFSPGDGNLTDYYTGIVKTAIENGGRYREHQIPVPWLRMILAGLESRQIDPDKMWFEVEWDAASSPLTEIPSYQDVFPSQTERFAGLR